MTDNRQPTTTDNSQQTTDNDRQQTPDNRQRTTTDNRQQTTYDRQQTTTDNRQHTTDNSMYVIQYMFKCFLQLLLINSFLHAGLFICFVLSYAQTFVVCLSFLLLPFNYACLFACFFWYGFVVDSVFTII